MSEVARLPDEKVASLASAVREGIATNGLDTVLRDDKEHANGIVLYHVVIQGEYFDCGYTNTEMDGIVQTCSDIIMELHHIASNGYTREKLDAIDAAENEKNPDMTHDGGGVARASNEMAILRSYNDFATPHLEELVTKVASLTRVGGAYYMFLSRPVFVSAIYSVFDMILGKFDEQDMWASSLIFLVRAALYMHSKELPKEEGKKYFPNYDS